MWLSTPQAVEYLAAITALAPFLPAPACGLKVHK